MLFDLQTDPNEYSDLGQSAKHAGIRAELLDKMFAWSRQHHNRVTTSDDYIEKGAGKEFFKGIYIGFWDEEEIEQANRLGEGGN